MVESGRGVKDDLLISNSIINSKNENYTTYFDLYLPGHCIADGQMYSTLQNRLIGEYHPHTLREKKTNVRPLYYLPSRYSAFTHYFNQNLTTHFFDTIMNDEREEEKNKYTMWNT